VSWPLATALHYRYNLLDSCHLSEFLFAQYTSILQNLPAACLRCCFLFCLSFLASCIICVYTHNLKFEAYKCATRIQANKNNYMHTQMHAYNCSYSPYAAVLMPTAPCLCVILHSTSGWKIAYHSVSNVIKTSKKHNARKDSTSGRLVQLYSKLLLLVQLYSKFLILYLHAMRYVQLGPKTAEELLNSQTPTICNMPAHLTIRLLSVIVIVWAACGLALLASSALDKSICILALAVYSCGLVVSFRHEPKVLPTLSHTQNTHTHPNHSHA